MRSRRTAGDGGRGGTACTMYLVCSRCRECGKECGRMVRSGAFGGDRRRSADGGAVDNGKPPHYCSDKCAARAAGRTRRAPAGAAAPRRKRSGSATPQDVKALRRRLQGESAEHRRRVEADPRLIIHCHWCMREAHARLLDPDWWCAGQRRRIILLCSGCTRGVKKFMRERGYEMVRTDNQGAARIMEEIAGAGRPAARGGGGGSRGGRGRKRNA